MWNYQSGRPGHRAQPQGHAAVLADTDRIAVAAHVDPQTLGSNNSGSLTVSQGIAGFKSDGSRYSLPGAAGRDLMPTTERR
jgi:hypothetical protein